MLRAALIALAALGGILAVCAAPAGAESTVTDNDQYTVFLLQSEAPDGSQVFTDSSVGHTEPHPITVVGNVRHSTARARFGASSIYFDGNSYLSIPDSDDWFLESPYTIDLWVNFEAWVGVKQAMVCQGDFGIFQYLYLNLTPPKRLCWQESNLVYLPANADSFELDRWYHIALTKRRSSGPYCMFIDGVIMSCSLDQGSNNLADPLTIGTLIGYNHWFQGYMEELRISKGICRWTNDFTPPGAPAGTATPQFTATPAPVPAATWPGLLLLAAALTGLLVGWHRH